MKKVSLLASCLIFAAFFAPTVTAQTEAQKVALCTKIAGDATFLSSYTIQLDAAQDGQRPPIFRQAVAIKKGNRYRFSICTDEESVGEAILQLYDEGKMMVSSYDPNTGKTFQNFDFDCSKTAYYVIFVSFKDGRQGSAISVLSHVKTL